MSRAIDTTAASQISDLHMPYQTVRFSLLPGAAARSSTHFEACLAAAGSERPTSQGLMLQVARAETHVARPTAKHGSCSILEVLRPTRSSACFSFAVASAGTARHLCFRASPAPPGTAGRSGNQQREHGAQPANELWWRLLLPIGLLLRGQ